MYANTEWITHKWGDRLPRAHLDSEVMKRDFPSPSIILTIHLLLFVLLFLNRISVQNYDREDKRRHTQWRRMDAESLHTRGRVYDCMATHCVDKIKGFVISLRMYRHSLSWLMSWRQFHKKNTNFHLIPVEPPHSYFTVRTAEECLYLGLQCATIAVHTNYSITGLLRESTEFFFLESLIVGINLFGWM